MKQTVRRLIAALGSGLLVLGLAAAVAPPSQADDEYKVLVVGKTLGFRHSSIDEGTAAVIELGQENGFTVDVWDPAQPGLTLPSTPFTSAEDLAQYATVVFISTVDGTNFDPNRATLLNQDELAAYQGYIQAGGGFVGVHGASDSMHFVPWYGGLVGGDAYFRNHPAQQTATLRLEDPTHPSTGSIPAEWTLFEEWYNFKNNPRDVVRVLLTLDETSYNPGFGAMGEDHPYSWCHNYDGGRSWYTALGHREDTLADPTFRAHLLGGIEWTAGVASGGGDCVTFYEVSNLVDDLAAAGGVLNDVAAKNITKHLDLAEAAADSGDHALALEELHTAQVLTGALVKDGEDSATLAGKIGDLMEWQQGLADA
ncbi:MAG TPA: ThuA domain-containing protein [Jiangellaceae bacterium]